MATKFGGNGGAEFGPAFLELIQAVLFQLLGDVAEIDADGRQLAEQLASRVVAAGDGVAGNLAVIGERGQRRAWHGG